MTSSTFSRDTETTFPFDLAASAVDQFPEALTMARSLANDLKSLNVIQAYLIRKGILAEEHAATAIQGYCKFLILALATGESISPSKEADEVWHAHILHTKLYGPWCDKHFGRFIHHIPTTPNNHPSSEAIVRQAELGTLFYGSLAFEASSICIGGGGDTASICQHNCHSCHACTPGDSGSSEPA